MIFLMSDAPHLPQRTMTPEQQQQWQRVSWLLFIVFVSFFVGAVGAIVVSSWVIPQQVIPYTTIYNVGGPANLRSVNLFDPLVSQQTEQRLLRMYDADKKIDGLYKENSFLGQAVVLSAGGWAVLYNPALVSTNYSKWEFVDFEGNVYSAEKAISDKQRKGLFFIKVAGEDFRGDIIFPNWRDIETVDVFAAVGRQEVSPVAISGMSPVVQKEASYRLGSTTYRYDVVGDAAVGDIVMTKNGEFVGFVDSDATLLGGWHVQSQLVSLFSKGEPSYGELPIRGFFVDRISGVHPGFYVSQILGTSTDAIQQGDIIIKLQDQFLDDIDIERVMSTLPSDVPVTILRNGEQLQVLLTKQNI